LAVLRDAYIPGAPSLVNKNLLRFSTCVTRPEPGDSAWRAVRISFAEWTTHSDARRQPLVQRREPQFRVVLPVRVLFCLVLHRRYPVLIDGALSVGWMLRLVSSSRSTWGSLQFHISITPGLAATHCNRRRSYAETYRSRLHLYPLRQ
jgi:hypothetical protein